MDKERVKELAKNPRRIPGIYNYCDQWCERCRFTSRCVEYEINEELYPEDEPSDINNAEFWDKLTETFQETQELLEEAIEEHGIRFDSADAEDKSNIQEQQDSAGRRARNHELTRAAEAYSDMAIEWMYSHETLFKEKSEELNREFLMDLPNLDPEAEFAAMKDAIAVVHWYQHFLPSKIMRAVSSLEHKHRPLSDEMPNDWDGSAKVALIAMDRSIEAWSQFWKAFPEEEDRILSILVHLERMRRKTETTFPNARAFIRPGFDHA